MTIGYSNYNYSVPSATSLGYNTGATTFQGGYVPAMTTAGYDTVDLSQTTQKKKGSTLKTVGTLAAVGLGIAAIVKGKKSGAQGIKNILKTGFKGLWDDAGKLVGKLKGKITGNKSNVIEDTVKNAKEAVLSPKVVQDANEVLVEKFGKETVKNMSDVAYFHALGDIC